MTTVKLTGRSASGEHTVLAYRLSAAEVITWLGADTRSAGKF